ncbi:hypothetical protein [Saccharothrix sp. HUAS TT1]|uniref:hypothetical protein n=1 Tax=unclassified Saccharothrix TaxID=2593673 RepID=UPI00345C1688
MNDTHTTPNPSGPVPAAPEDPRVTLVREWFEDNVGTHQAADAATSAVLELIRVHPEALAAVMGAIHRQDEHALGEAPPPPVWFAGDRAAWRGRAVEVRVAPPYVAVAPLPDDDTVVAAHPDELAPLPPDHRARSTS